MKKAIAKVRQFVDRASAALPRWLAPRSDRGGAKRRSVLAGLSMTPGHPAAQRSLEDWKRLRKLTTLEVKKLLEDAQPAIAIRKLTRALLEDPHYVPYVDLLQQAVSLKRLRKSSTARKDLWQEVSSEESRSALQLEAFIAYVQELDVLISRAGLSSHAPAVARRDRQSPS